MRKRMLSDSGPRSGDELLDRYSDPREARKKAMDYLARREYGRQELQLKLMGAGFEKPIAQATVEQLAGEGLQDDARFTESFVRSRVHQGKGPVRIRMELERRGIDAGTICQMLDDSAEDWRLLAREVRIRKFGAAVPSEFREKARQMRFLQYRGFDTEQVQAAVAGDEAD